HTENDHRMVVANTSQSHQKSTAKDKIPFAADRSGVDDTVQGSILKFAYEDLVTAGKYTLWDHKFELVGKKYEAQEVSRFSIGGNQNLEVYDFPGEFAQRFDGISAGGGEQSGELQKIFQDNKRTAKIRQEELDVEYRQAPALRD